MGDTEFLYMGKKIEIHDEHPNAVVSVDGREFHCHHHHPEAGGLPMWMCDEAYFASPDLNELAMHFADYGYMFDAPGRVVVNDEGVVVDQTKSRAVGKAAPVKKVATKKSATTTNKKATKKATGGHDHGGGQ